MKILIDARMYGLEHSGIGRYLINLIRWLNKSDLSNQYIILLRTKYFNEMKLGKNWIKVKSDIRHYTLDEQIIIPNIISKEKPDIVHFPHFNIPVLTKEKFVITIHDMTMHHQGINATKLPLPLYLIKKIPYKFVFENAIKRSENIITPSKSVKKEIVKYYGVKPDKIVVCYEGIDDYSGTNNNTFVEKKILEKYQLKNNNYFFYVGNAYPHKNLEVVVQAISIINKNNHTKHLFAIAGSSNFFMQRLGKKIKKYGASKYVKLLGFVPEQDLGVLYKNSISFIYPSLSEGFGLQGLEAIANGTVLLASDIDIFREVYGSHAFYFNPRDVVSLSSAMVSVLSLNDADKCRYLLTAQKFIKKYSWEKMAQDTLRVYEKL